MPGLDPEMVSHALNIELGAKPVVQPRRIFHLNIEAQIVQEVKKLLAARFIKLIEHLQWLSNIVPMKKKNGKIRCCVDFWDLKKVCTKDEFPLPNMDLLIDLAAGHEMFSFMDGFSGYNKIKMEARDAAKILNKGFMTTKPTVNYLMKSLCLVRRCSNNGTLYKGTENQWICVLGTTKL